MDRPARNFDAVVLGCGIAGLSAAVSAAEAGARVVVLERAALSERGGNTRYTEAFLRMKSESEIADDFEDHFAANSGAHVDPSLIKETLRSIEEWSPVAKTLSFLDPELIAAFAGEVPPTISWLKGMGVRFEALPTPFLTRSAPKLMPIGGGMALIEALATKAERLGVTFRYEIAGIELILDSSGRVNGVCAVEKNNRRTDVIAPNTVLACGGFEGNAEMMTQYLGPHAAYIRPIARGGYYNRGDGIRMALKIGAAPSGEYGNYHAEPMDPRSGIAEPSVFIFPYGVLVNRDGCRFVDEAPGPVDATYEQISRRTALQPGGIAYAILDQKVEEIPNYKVSLRTDQPPIVANTLDDLAAKLQLPREEFAASIADFNRACQPGRFIPTELDGLSTSNVRPRKSNFARPIDKPPFRAWPIISGNVFTFGGLKVNANAQVLNVQGDAITGLYAGGEVIGLYYGAYTGATSVLRGATFGRIAGRHLASTGATVRAKG